MGSCSIKNGPGEKPMSLDSNFEASEHQIQDPCPKPIESETFQSYPRDSNFLSLIGCCTLNETGLIQDVTLRAATMLTAENAVLFNRPFSNVVFHEDQTIFSKSFQRLHNTGMPQTCELRLVKDETLPFWASLTLSPTLEDGTNLHHCVVMFSDIAEQRHLDVLARQREYAQQQELYKLHRILNAQNRSGKIMMYATDETQYLHDVCSIVVENCGHAMVWIGFAQQDEEKSVLPVAYSGFEAGYLENLHISWGDTERGRGPTGVAIRTGEPNRCRNMLSDPAFVPWRTDAVNRGYASSLALPIRTESETLGALTIYSREPDAFSDDEVALLLEVADDLAFGIVSLRLRNAHAQMELSLRQSEERYRSLVEMSPDALLVYRNHQIVFANSAALRLFGASTTDQILKLSPFDLFYPCFHDHLKKQIETLLAAETTPFSELRIIRFDGTERFIEAASASFEDSEGRAVQIVLRDVTERKEVEQENAWLASYSELNPNPVTEVDTDAGSVSYLNRAACEAFPDLAERGIQHPWLADLSDMATRMRAEGVKTIWREVQIGEACYRQSVNLPFEDQRIRLYGIDITDRKLAEDALNKAKAEAEEGQHILDALMEYVPEGITIVEAPSLKIRMISRYGRKFFGERFEGMTVEEFILRYPTFHKDGTPMPLEDLPLSHAIHKGEIVQNMVVLQCDASGNLINISCNAAPIRDMSGAVIGGVAAWQDVTELSKTQEALRKSEESLREYAQQLEQRVLARTEELSQSSYYSRSLIEASLDPLVTISPDGEITDVNRATELATGKSREELIGTDFSNYFIEPDKAHDAYQQVLSDGQITNYPLTIRHVSGKTMHVLYNATVYRSADGKTQGVFAAARDITERLQAQEEAKIREQQLLQADKMVSLGILVSGVAHEINNPNHSIMTNAAALADVWKNAQPILDRFEQEYGDFVLGGYDYSESRDTFPGMFANLLASSRRIQVIVDELRDFARYNPGEHMTDIDVGAIVQSSVILMSNMIHKSTDLFHVHIDPGLPPVCANRQRIEQVLINLIQNACQALPDRERGVEVTAVYMQELHVIQIAVQDDGVGIPKDNLPHLGDPFFTTKRTVGGMGLGLWVCFNIVHEHGGTLTFESQEGQGTRAVLTLPVIGTPREPALSMQKEEINHTL